MSTKKPPPTLESVARALIQQAEENAKRYCQTSLNTYEDREELTATNAFVYAYLLAGLRMNHGPVFGPSFKSTEVVAEAMKQYFGILNDDFATDILGG